MRWLQVEDEAVCGHPWKEGFCLAKKLDLCPIENGGHSFQGSLLCCDMIKFPFYKNHSCAGAQCIGGDKLRRRRYVKELGLGLREGRMGLN